MKRVTGGAGQDTTSSVLTWLAAGGELTLATLYLIGEINDPQALWLTDWESPLLWSPWGTFQPAVVKRGTVSNKIGFEVDSLDISLSASTNLKLPAPIVPYLSAGLNAMAVDSPGVLTSLIVHLWVFVGSSYAGPFHSSEFVLHSSDLGTGNNFFLSIPSYPYVSSLTAVLEYGGQSTSLSSLTHPLISNASASFIMTVHSRYGTLTSFNVSLSGVSGDKPRQDVTVNVDSLQATTIKSIGTSTVYQLAQVGYYDNWRVRAWTVYMPTPGDANTYGASELFGGRVADTTIERGDIKFKVSNFLDVVNQKVPTNIIELLNTAAAYAGATPPPGFSHIPQFNVVTGNSTTVVEGDCTNIGPHQIFTTNVFQHGFLVFNGGAGSTLGGIWSAIQQNVQVTIGGIHYNQFILYAPLPWPPTPGVDTFYVSGASPINKADGSYVGFPYIPSPESAV